MSARSVEIFRYDLPLVRPLDAHGTTLTARSGYILKVGDEEGTVGYGDIAPLPGFSHDTLDEALEAATAWSNYVVGHAAADRDRMVRALACAPSAMFGVEWATFAVAHAAGAAFAQDVFIEGRRVAVNALIDGSIEEALGQADALGDQGYRAVKVKVGRQKVARDVEMVREVRRVVGDGVAVRVDANRGWDLERALAFARGVADVGIDYIEEPLATTEDLEQFAREGGLGVALDETGRDTGYPAGFFAERPWLKAVILKPTLLGGVRMSLQWARGALQHGIRPVVSACFESGVGIAALAHLAAGISEDDVPMGLDTYQWLAGDVLQERFMVRDGAYDLDELDACVATIDTDTLEPVHRG